MQQYKSSILLFNFYFYTFEGKCNIIHSASEKKCIGQQIFKQSYCY